MKNLLIVNAINAIGDFSDSVAFDADAIAAKDAALFDKNKITVNHKVDEPLEITVGNGADIMPDTFRIERKNARCVKTDYAAGGHFVGTFTVSLDGVSSYSYKEVYINITKKGAVFNERNVWTTSAHGSTASDVAADLAKNINKSMQTHGLKATVSGAVITLTGSDFTDYAISGAAVGVGTSTDPYAKAESKINGSVTTVGSIGVGTPEYVAELAMKCMADKGVNSTYVDALSKGVKESNHFTDGLGIDGSATYDIYTITYYNPRYDHNIDEPLKAVLHLAVKHSLTATDLVKALNNQSLS